MIETLGTTLIVIFCVMIFMAQAAGIATFVILLSRGKRITALESELAAAKVKIDASKTEIIDGQFKLAELVATGLKANTDYLNKVAKEMVDSNFDLVTKNTDDVLKLNTSNSQKVYDALVVLIQMTNGLMTALGYRPSASAPDSGLQEPKRGPNYGQPPAPGDLDDLTFAR